MALIKCPECGKEISDKVKACPHCGFPFNELNEPDKASSTLPQEVEVTGVKIKNPKIKKIVIIGLILVALLSALLVGFRIYSDQKSKSDYESAFNSYIDTATEAQLLMLSGGASSEDLANLTLNVWQNAIFEDSDPITDKYTKPNGYFVSDFNTALSNLFSDSSTVSKISNIKNNQDNVKNLMKKLQNPPTGLETCYSTITDLYSAYLGFTNLAINPTGSLQTFSEDFHDKDSKFMEIFHKLEANIPEKISGSK